MSDKKSFRNTTEQVAYLNDRLRCDGIGGKIVVTNSIAELSISTKAKIFQAIQKFDTFNEDNDPYGEHDMGFLNVDNLNLAWKIDYYDNKLECHSPDKADPNVTTRIMTVMLQNEY